MSDSYELVLIRQALVLIREHGTAEQLDRWAAEVERWLGERLWVKANHQ